MGSIQGSEAVRRNSVDRTALAGNSDQPEKSGVYEALVVGHVEGSRSGELLVKIIDESGSLSNDINELKKTAATAAYASPFFGKTYLTDAEALTPGPATSGQSYGMWFVPPDIGCKVLVMYISGNQNRLFWFACVYDTPSHHMVPGIARSIAGAGNTFPPQSSIPVSGDSVLPVVEYSTNANIEESGTETDPFGPNAITRRPRYPHEYQASVLVLQGLDRDPIRGAISSSSMREVPSNVYGISTPGKKGTLNDQIPGQEDLVIFRKGGHTFVMDDGDKDGKDQLIRLRTTAGHQILMNDTEQVLYIASASGMHWMEFSNTGELNVYARGGYNLRADGPINFHSESAIKMTAPMIKLKSAGTSTAPIGSIDIYTTGTLSMSAFMAASLKSNGLMSVSAMGKLNVAAGAAMSIGALGKTSISGALVLLNCGTKAIPIPVGIDILDDKVHLETKLVNNRWVGLDGSIKSSCTVVPAHEPWVDEKGQRPKNKRK